MSAEETDKDKNLDELRITFQFVRITHVLKYPWKLYLLGSDVDGLEEGRTELLTDSVFLDTWSYTAFPPFERSGSDSRTSGFFAIQRDFVPWQFPPISLPPPDYWFRGLEWKELLRDFKGDYYTVLHKWEREAYGQNSKTLCPMNTKSIILDHV